MEQGETPRNQPTNWALCFGSVQMELGSKVLDKATAQIGGVILKFVQGASKSNFQSSP
jgi:hypothetical protein